MNTLIIYDETGFVISVRSGQPAPREPIGVPFLNVVIPEGKRIKTTDGIGVDTSVTPHQAFLEDIPLTDIEKLRLETAQANAEMFEMVLMMTGGGM